jgi:hypothetical protein
VFSNLQKLDDPGDTGIQIVVFSVTSTLSGLGRFHLGGLGTPLMSWISRKQMPYFIKAFGH